MDDVQPEPTLADLTEMVSVPGWTIRILFPLAELRVGEYFPALFAPVGLQVAVDVPMDQDHIANYEDLTDKDAIPVTPILTVAGLRYCQQQLYKAFRDPLEADPHDTIESTHDDEGWE